MSRSSVKETEMKQAARESAARPVPGVAAVVMAAGLGKRMQSKHAKVLHSVAGRAMVLYSVDLALRVAGHQIAVIVGHQADRVSQVIKDATGHRKRACARLHRRTAGVVGDRPCGPTDAAGVRGVGSLHAGAVHDSQWRYSAAS
jgi:CTP:molybdopterin cytidylyltransferase MocA